MVPGALARRNPGVFLAGSVALGFGIARFFKARGPQSRSSYGGDSQYEGEWQSGGARDGVYSEEDLDLSAGSAQRGAESGSDRWQAPETQTPESEGDGSSQGKPRQSGKQKVKPQRAASGQRRSRLVT